MCSKVHGVGSRDNPATEGPGRCEKILLDTTLMLRSGIGTLCIPWQVCLSGRCSLVLSCVVWWEIEEEQIYSFCAREDWEPSLCLDGKNPCIPDLRYASQVPPIRSQCLNTVNYRVFGFIQSSAIALAHSVEPYIHNYGELVENTIAQARTRVEGAALQSPLPHLWTAR